MKLDILVFAAHPDDAELACGGTLASLSGKGKKIGIADLTQGEMGTRGTVETRRMEAADSAKIIGLSVREQLYLPDTQFGVDRENQVPLIRMIRKYQPDIVLCNAPDDRHPDHGRSARLESDACFISGLAKIETEMDGEKQVCWRPRLVFHYIQDRMLKPDFIVDISNYWPQKLAAIQAFKTQFYDPDSPEPDTYISGQSFINFLEARAREFGHQAGVEFGEGFISPKALGMSSFDGLI